jgi:predicted SAM-dependent methyltransferase
LSEEKPRTVGLARALRALAAESRSAELHRRGLVASARYRGTRGLRLNLGCGPNQLDGWVNVDLAGRPDLTLDLREPLPFDDGAAERIYSEHFLEHLERADARRLVREMRRVLAPGGRLRLGVPDTEWPLRAYASAEEDDYFRLARERWHPRWCTTRLDHLNYHFRQQGEHLDAYDFPTLEELLRAGGFERVERSGFDPALDSEERRIGTLYVEAS